MAFHQETIQISNFVTPSLCWHHTVPKLTQDGNTMIEIFKFGSDRENIGPFVRASLAIVWSPVDFSGSGSNFVSGAQIFGMSKNSRKAREGAFLY